ncbi:MAG: hypothetical protein AAGG48_02065 [Planctomycetota bacterium]
MSFLIGCDNESRTGSLPQSDSAVEEDPPKADTNRQQTAESGSTQSSSVKPSSKDDPLSAKLSVLNPSVQVGESFELSVVLTIERGYEIHDREVSPPFFPTKLELELPQEFECVGDWQAPDPIRSAKPTGGRVYVGKVIFKQQICVSKSAAPGTHLLSCKVSYQACDAVRCLSPIDSELSIVVPVVP